MENSVQTDVLIMDFSKAFDKVSHNLLTHKLNCYGIQGLQNKWIHSFLSNRTQAASWCPYRVYEYFIGVLFRVMDSTLHLSG
jgi:hypothetical protein